MIMTFIDHIGHLKGMITRIKKSLAVATQAHVLSSPQPWEWDEKHFLNHHNWTISLH